MELGLEWVTANHFGYSHIICSTSQPLLKVIQCWFPVVGIVVAVLVDASKAKLRRAKRQKGQTKAKRFFLPCYWVVKLLLTEIHTAFFDACKRKMHDKHGIDKATRQTDVITGGT